MWSGNYKVISKSREGDLIWVLEISGLLAFSSEY